MAAAMVRHPGLRLFDVAIVDGETVAGGGEMAGHGGAHDAQPYESDTCHGLAHRT